MLPARIDLHDEEALDSFLERVATANDLTSAQLVRLLTAANNVEPPTLAFMTVRPAEELVQRIASLTGRGANQIHRATLMRFDGGRPLTLDGFDPRDRSSFRNVVTSGWFPNQGTQCCPRCLAADGVWRIRWRLPMSSACPDHRCYLVPTCPGCGKRFRARHAQPFRPLLLSQQVCGNPVGVHEQCRQPLLGLPTQSAPESVLVMAGRVDMAVDGCRVPVLGRARSAADYLVELRNLSTLLLHLACRPNARLVAGWCAAVQDEARTRRTELRGPRWGIQPPASAISRGLALAEADAILAREDSRQAAPRLLEWLSLIRGLQVGPYGWVKNRTVLTPAVAELVLAALSTTRHVGRRLEAGGAVDFPTTAIPQVLPTAMFQSHFRGMFGASETTSRLYVALCLARLATGSRTWDDAATVLGLPSPAGRRIARAAAGRMRVPAARVEESVEGLARVLPTDRDYRILEQRVRALAIDASWFINWRTFSKPARASNTLPYAITWMWCQSASAWLYTSPAWDGIPARSARIGYRAFARRLPQSFQHALESAFIDPVRQTLAQVAQVSKAPEGSEDGPVNQTN